MSNIDGTVTTTVSIIGADATPAPGEYRTVLTLGALAGVMPAEYAANGVTTLFGGASLVNHGVIHGGSGALVTTATFPPTLSGGNGIYFIPFGAVTNTGTIAGGLGGLNSAFYVGGNGGIGIDLAVGGALNNTGHIGGGAGGAALAMAGTGGTGGIGVALGSGDGTNISSFYNGGSITGGTGGAGSFLGGDAGNGLDLFGSAAGVILHNQGGIVGGAGGAGVGATGYGKAGAIGVDLSSGATFSNDPGGYVVGGAGGNSAAAVAGAGGLGASVIDSNVINTVGASLSGGSGGVSAGTGSGAAGGDGAQLSGAQAILQNDGTLAGGTGGTDGIHLELGGTGGAGARVVYGATLNNTGFIQGGASSAAAGGGIGTYLNGATLTTSGVIAGGVNGSTRSSADAVQFGQAAATLIVDPGARFFGNVVANAASNAAAHAAANDTLELAGGVGNRLLTGFGSQFTGFSSLVFDPDTGWTVVTTAAGISALNTIQGFDATDTIDITDLNFVPGATASFANNVLGIQDGDAALTLDINGGFTTHQFAVTPDGTGGTDVTLQAACYRRGTHIRTARGEVQIEDLVIGDLIITASGAARALRWLGSRRIECHRYPDPSMVWPIRIRAGAFADGAPARDLWVSPGHCLFIDGVLIQAEKLVNGASILRVPRARVEYWHLELDRHDILFAEGLAAESYLDTGNRHAFNNGGAFIEAFPDFQPKHWTDTCAPIVKQGAALQSARARLLERSARLGAAITHDAAVHLVADGERIDPLRLGAQRLVFTVPPGRCRIALRCRTFIPAHVDPASDDPRALGICVGRLQLDGVEIPLDNLDIPLDALDKPLHGMPPGPGGWHELERFADGHMHRWTRAHLPLPPGTRLVLIDLAGLSHCWALPAQSAQSAARQCGDAA